MIEENNTREDTREKIRSIGFKCALAVVFIRFSALPELIASITGTDTYILYLFGPFALLAVFFSGGLRRTFREKPAKFWLCFVFWMILAVPFSSWKGGSFGLVMAYVRTNFIMLFIIAGLARKWADCRKVIYTVAAAAIFNMASAYLAQTGGDRLGFSWSGTLGNSDDLAAHLLLVLPFVLFVGLKPRTHLLVRLISIGAVLLGTFQILRTASRGALVALVITGVFLFLRGSLRQRSAVVATAAAIFVIMVLFLPPATLNRITSFSNTSDASEEALESSENRQYLLKMSIIFTLQNPIFGVGPGQFSSYEGKTMARAGKSASWHGAHNSYTQISSECGIPAFVFYLAAAISTFKLLTKTRKRANETNEKEMVTAVNCISVGLFAYAAAILFVNFGYAYEFIAVTGLAIAIWSASNELSMRSPDNNFLLEAAPHCSQMESIESN